MSYSGGKSRIMPLVVRALPLVLIGVALLGFTAPPALGAQPCVEQLGTCLPPGPLSESTPRGPEPSDSGVVAPDAMLTSSTAPRSGGGSRFSTRSSGSPTFSVAQVAPEPATFEPEESESSSGGASADPEVKGAQVDRLAETGASSTKSTVLALGLIALGLAFRLGSRLPARLLAALR